MGFIGMKAQPYDQLNDNIYWEFWSELELYLPFLLSTPVLHVSLRTWTLSYNQRIRQWSAYMSAQSKWVGYVPTRFSMLVFWMFHRRLLFIAPLPIHASDLFLVTLAIFVTISAHFTSFLLFDFLFGCDRVSPPDPGLSLAHLPFMAPPLSGFVSHHGGKVWHSGFRHLWSQFNPFPRWFAINRGHPRISEVNGRTSTFSVTFRQ